MRRMSFAVSLGVLAAAVAGSGAASAALLPSPNHVVTKTTIDGMTAQASLVNVTVNTVPNLAQSPWTREAFIDATAIGQVDGEGAADLKSGVLKTGVEVGCNTDVSSGIQTGSSTSAGPSASVTISPTPSVDLGANASLGQSVLVTLKPGMITSVPIGERTLDGPIGAADLSGIHVSVDDCLGPVSVRLYATFTTSGHIADTVVTVYSDPIMI